MKRTLVALLMSGVLTLSIGCSKTNNDAEKSKDNSTVISDEADNEEYLNDASGNSTEDTSVDLEQEENGKDESVSIESKENYEKNYNIVKEMLENNKMTVVEEENTELQVKELIAENGIGDSLSYKLMNDGAIEIIFNVEINNILNVESYKITGTALDEIMSAIKPSLEYVTEVEEAIIAYVDEGVQSTEIRKDNVTITVNGSYDKVEINVIIK